MKLAGWKRAVLAGLMTVTVVGGSLATFTAGDAAAFQREWCYPVGAGDIYECVPLL